MMAFSGRVLLSLFVWVFTALVFFCANKAQAQAAICAEVKIEIRQKVSLERQAFDVALKINNGLTDRSIDALRVTLLVTDLSGNPVAFTSDANNTGALFFYRVDSLTGTTAIDGTSNVAAATQAEARWLFIPSAGAAGTLPSGKQYRIGASIGYTLAGQAQSVDVEPEVITVRAQPKLKLDYFLQQDIYADDPFTAPVEPSEPATLGVRVRNVGLGAANNTRIDSAQPKIVENRQGLAIAFKLEGGYVDDQSRGNSLLLDFGAIAPGKTAMGRWDLTTTLAGRFTEFGANFTHADALGGALTSLIDSVTTRFLLRDVIVDLQGRDAVRDFLSSDGGLVVYESDSVDTPVVDVSTNATLAPVATGYRLTHQTSPLLTYSKLPSPGNANLSITSVVRSDSKVLNPRNYWVSKKRNADLSWSYFINVFDSQTTGDYLINATGISTASLSGQVFDDANADNLYQTSEPGIGVVRIDLEGTLDDGGRTTNVAYTDQNGLFSFIALQPGTYTVAVGPTPARVDGAPTLGSVGGTLSTTTSGSPAINGIVISSNTQATGYRFAKQRSAGNGATDIRVVVTPTKATMRAGATAALLVSVDNVSTNAAQAVSVRLTIPSFASIGSVTPSAGTYDNTAAVWYVGNLAPNQKANLSLSLSALSTMSPPMSASFEATGSTASAESNTSNNASTAAISFSATPTCQSSGALTIEPLVLIRYLNGLRGASLVLGVFGASDANPALAATIEQNLAANLSAYDFDGSGNVTPEVDGILYARWASGVRGADLIAGLSLRQGSLLADIEAALGGCQ
jgi:hypothetical protein